MDLEQDKQLTFEALALATANSLNCSLLSPPKKINLNTLAPSLKFWLVKQLSWHGFMNIRILPDRDIKGGCFLKVHHGRGIATIYPTIGNGYIQLEVVASRGQKLAPTIYEELKKTANFRRRDTKHLTNRLKIYKEKHD